MNAGLLFRKIARLGISAVFLVLIAFPAGPTRLGNASVWAQDGEAPAKTAAREREPAAPPSLPHMQFLLDYLLVLILIAGAVYAVCRPSRRV